MGEVCFRCALGVGMEELRPISEFAVPQNS